MRQGDWFKLKRGSDWGVCYWSREPLKDGFASERRRYRLSPGEEIRCRMRDGTERVATVAVRTEPRRIGDHGHEYSFNDKVPELEFPDGTRASLDVVELQYEPDRDPTVAEVMPSIK